LASPTKGVLSKGIPGLKLKNEYAHPNRGTYENIMIKMTNGIAKKNNIRR
jgi:hypothetical protein